MNLLKEFTSFIKKENLFQQKDKLLVAVSGGIDSVVLCELCKQAGYDFVMAHCNFQLREAESERDEEFVKSLAEKYGVKVFVKKFDTEKYALKNRIGIQEAARKLRYDWFNEIVKEQSAISNQQSAIGNRKLKIGNLNTHHSPLTTHILTAHHANDNVETLLMNFFKGTGINGLRGILPKHGNVIRPLLFATKKEIKAFAEENNLSFVEDSSNVLDKYTRNFFRHQIIPPIIPGFIFGPLYLLLSAYLDKRGGGNINHSAHIWGALFGVAFLIIATRLYSNVDIWTDFVDQVRYYFKTKLNIG